MSKNPSLRLSYSKAKTYDCPMKFFFKYVKKMPDKSNSRNSLPGRVIQKLFELFCNMEGFKNGSQWLYDNVADVFEDEYQKQVKTTKFHADETYDDVLHEVVDMIPACYDLFVKKGWNNYRVQSEIWIEARLSGSTSLVGSLDFLITKGDTAIIIDFKSTSKGLNALDKDQLIIYNYLYKNKYGKLPTETYFFLCRDNKLVKLNVTNDDLDDIIKRLNYAAEGIIKKDYHKNPSKSNCRFCPFKKQCWGSARNCPW